MCICPHPRRVLSSIAAKRMGFGVWIEYVALVLILLYGFSGVSRVTNL